MALSKEERRRRQYAAMQRYREAHRERLRAVSRTYYAENREKYAANNRRWRKANPDKANAKKRRHYLRHLDAVLWKKAKERAQKEGVPFGLTFEFAAELVAPMRCSETGIPLESRVGGRGPGPWSPTIDRIVPALGYVPGNVRLVCHSFNTTNKYTLRGNDAEIRERVLRRYARG